MSAHESPAKSPGAEAAGARSLGSVREEQVRLLFRFSLVGYLATLLVIFILGAVLWDQLARPLLFAWFAAISLITIGRYALYKVFINRDPPSAGAGPLGAAIPRRLPPHRALLGRDRRPSSCPIRRTSRSAWRW